MDAEPGTGVGEPTDALSPGLGVVTGEALGVGVTAGLAGFDGVTTDGLGEPPTFVGDTEGVAVGGGPLGVGVATATTTTDVALVPALLPTTTT